MKGWKRSMLFSDTGLTWVFPSPNMPDFQTALVYPGQVLFEGTNISEGRGTTKPFELVGAPFADHEELLALLHRAELPGCFFRPLMFRPTSGKWAKTTCTGFQLHVTDPATFRPYRTGLALLQSFLLLYPDKVQYKEPPYEYEYHRLPLDMIIGSTVVRQALERGDPVTAIEASWSDDLTGFELLRKRYFLYD